MTSSRSPIAARSPRAPRRAAARLLLALLLAAPGCALATPEPPEPVPDMDMVGDELMARAPASPARVFSAAALVFQRMGLGFVDLQQQRDEGWLVVRFDDGREVVLHARARAAGGSRLALKVGDAGDERVARRLLDTVLAELRG